MKEIKLPGGVLKTYDSIHETPQKRAHAMHRYSIVDAKIGSTLDDVNKRFERLDTYLVNGDIEAARQERRNQHFAIYLAINEINITSLTYACLHHSIDNVPIIDFSEENMLQVVKKTSKMGLTDGMVYEQLDALKKNLIHSFTQISLNVLLDQQSSNTMAMPWSA